jgi:hypothetical protein
MWQAQASSLARLQKFSLSRSFHKQIPGDTFALAQNQHNMSLRTVNARTPLAGETTPRTKKDDTTLKRGTIVFIHPDLGIGGAERLVIDAAVGLQESGYEVTIFTNHCDKNHCFDEARDGKIFIAVLISTAF